MFGTRLLAAMAATLVAGSFLLAQTGPSQPQGENLPGQQGNTPATAPAAQPVPAPAAQPGTQPVQPGVQPVAPAQSQQAPAQTQRQNQQNTQQPQTIQPQTNQQTTSQKTEEAHKQAKTEDGKFLVKAAEIDLAEINLGRLALQRSGRPDIRQFANQLVQDHSQNLQQLNQMANAHQWATGERMDQEHQQLFMKLAAMQGEQFDKEFVQKMIEGHKKAAELFEHASQNAQHDEIKQFAAQTLKAIKQHEQIAQRLAGQNQGTQATSTNQNEGTRTDGQRTDQKNQPNTNRNDQNRNDQNRTDPTRNQTQPNQPNRNDNSRSNPDRRDDR